VASTLCGLSRLQGAHQNDYLAAHPTGAFAQYFAIACNPMVLVSADPKRANQMALWAREEMTEAGLMP